MKRETVDYEQAVEGLSSRRPRPTRRLESGAPLANHRSSG